MKVHKGNASARWLIPLPPSSLTPRPLHSGHSGSGLPSDQQLQSSGPPLSSGNRPSRLARYRASARRKRGSWSQGFIAILHIEAIHMGRRSRQDFPGRFPGEDWLRAHGAHEALPGPVLRWLMLADDFSEPVVLHLAEQGLHRAPGYLHLGGLVHGRTIVLLRGQFTPEYLTLI